MFKLKGVLLNEKEITRDIRGIIRSVSIKNHFKICKTQIKHCFERYKDDYNIHCLYQESRKGWDLPIFFYIGKHRKRENKLSNKTKNIVLIVTQV